MFRKSDALASVRLFQSEVAGIREQDDPLSARLTVYVMAAMVVAFGLVLTFARVDRTVSSTTGLVITTQGTTDFQALDDVAIVKTIDVKEGQRVMKGQLLATLDPTFAVADVKQLKEQIDSLDAQIARDDAELAGRDLVFPANADADLGKYAAVQIGLFKQQIAQYNAQLNSFDQKIAETQATVTKFGADEAHYKNREDIARQVEDMRSTLLQKGAGSLLNLLTSTDSRIDVLRTLDFDHNSLIEAQHQLDSLKADKEAFVQQWLSTTSQELVTARTTRDGALNQLQKAVRHQDLVRLTAAEDSFVLTIAKVNVGSVMKAGDTLMSLAPAGAPIEAEVQMAARDVGFVRPGDPATLKIDAFNFAEHGTAEGTVRWISEGSFTRDDNGMPAPAYYKARLAIDSVNLTNVPPSFRLIPGMTLTADIKVGTRSLGAYILGGLLKTLGSSMREP